jgi:hypothetical protein
MTFNTPGNYPLIDDIRKKVCSQPAGVLADQSRIGSVCTTARHDHALYCGSRRSARHRKSTAGARIADGRAGALGTLGGFLA